MSLINKVLRDLEAQRADTGEARARRSPLVQEELHPVRPVKPQLSRRQLAIAGLAVASVAAAALAWNQWGAKWIGAGRNVPAPVAAVSAPAPDRVATGPVAPATTAAKTETPAPAKPVEAPKPRSLDVPVAVPKDAKPQHTDVPATAQKETKPEPPKPAAPTSARPPAADVVVRKEKPEVPPLAAEKTAVAKTKEPAAMESPAIDGPEPLPPAAEPREPTPPAGKAVLEKKLKPLTPEQRAESEYRQAAISLQQRRVGEGENHLRAALRSQPSHVKARELLAGLALQGGRWREAQSLLEQGVQLNPNHYPFAQLLARSYVDHGQEHKALALLEKSRTAAGADPDYFAFLAALYQRVGRQEDAARSFSEALKLRPKEGRWWLGFAISLEAIEKWKESAEAYQRALDSGSLDEPLLRYSQQRLAAVKNK